MKGGGGGHIQIDKLFHYIPTHTYPVHPDILEFYTNELIHKTTNIITQIPYILLVVYLSTHTIMWL